ncbi:MAG: aminomethyl-transferring glycine dehydrogenase [Ignavibacteriales bacterium]|nr:aminomethyl-transferring glycine dehydrogenase [Ignavibacteriales bacterium]MCB9219336.1 aminomethyl-transferring glycine dehydrogenase [Ignavibacteriales bacterium]
MQNIPLQEKFVDRHIGPRENEITEMLQTIGVDSVEKLIYETVPDNILITKQPELEAPITEYELLKEMQRIASKNKLFKNFIGMGYYETITPSPIKRNILENPGWYTQYTPYQAEISQGRLEALLNFQTMVIDLTGMQIANASLLDEGTAAAEAMSMFYSLRKGEKKNSNIFLISDNVFPQTIDVIKTRAVHLGIELRIENEDNFELTEDVFGIFVQYPGMNGSISNYEELFKSAKEKNIFCIAAADILSLVLLKSPGELGADCVVGSTQRFGVPMGFGGPHAAYFATKEDYKRSIPGRIIGISVDSKGRRALRMALQTREQHIKREKATSNICTAQVLLAIMAGMYAVYHGPDGLKNIALRIHGLSKYLYENLKNLKLEIVNKSFFDTITIKLEKEKINEIKQIALESQINLYYSDQNTISINIGENVAKTEIDEVIKLFNDVLSEKEELDDSNTNGIPESLQRESQFLTNKVFTNYRSETELMRYIKYLEKKDLSLTTSMIPLGSCTMKLNAASELYALSSQGFGNIHPFVPLDQAAGYLEMIKKLENQLSEITGLPGVSLQPNSGAQGEYTGLLVIKAYHNNRGESHRNIVLIPSSAHGTNPASAVLAGNKVVIVKCDEKGNIDVNDLKEKAELHKENLCALMVTYPSTHGVFEKSIVEINKIIHTNGGLVYMDGANLNAQLGITSPAAIGADVCHLNLHKTFAIPHGGGGPGVGPIAVTKELEEFLPGHSVIDINKTKSISAVSSAPFGSASVLTISYAYIRMMGFEGLKRASQIAILNANYIKSKLKNHFKTLYAGERGFVAHELIFDTRGFKTTANVEVEDIAKRLMDYGYHAPTVSFPVAGTLMVEPTESESKKELDKFCDTMEMIYNEIKEIESNEYDKLDNVLKNAPHTLSDIIGNWEHKYTIAKAVAPADWIKENKFWPSVGRVDNAYGDRNLVCSCLPLEEYEN